MDDLLELIHEYRSLRAHEGLDDEERARMVGLGALLGDEVPWLLSPSERKPGSFFVHFTVPGGFATGELRGLSGAGVMIGTRARPRPGTRMLLRIDNPRTHKTFVLPAEVAFRRPGRWAVFGARFDGASDVDSAQGTPWTSLRWAGAMSQRGPLVA